MPQHDEVNMAENEEIAELDIELVVERPIVPVTRFEEDGSVGVEWVGRCWAWLEEDGPPELRDVVVNDGEVVKLLEPGRLRRVRARQRPGETTDGGEVLEVWIDLAREAPEDRRAAARGLFEGGWSALSRGPSRRNSPAGSAGWSGSLPPPSRWTAGGISSPSRTWSRWRNRRIPMPVLAGTFLPDGCGADATSDCRVCGRHCRLFISITVSPQSLPREPPHRRPDYSPSGVAPTPTG